MNPLLIQFRNNETTFTVCSMVGERLWGITGQRLGGSIHLVVFNASQHTKKPLVMCARDITPADLERFCMSDKEHDKFEIYNVPLMNSVVTLIANHQDRITSIESILVSCKTPVCCFHFPLRKEYLLELCKQPLK